jgi:hypothetical protein
LHRQPGPVARAELEDRDRLVHPAEHCLMALEQLHQHARPASVVQERGARVVEVRVAVVAIAHLLDRKVEDLGVEARAPLAGRREGHRAYASSAARQAAIAASATSSWAAGRLAGRDPALELGAVGARAPGTAAARDDGSSSRTPRRRHPSRRLRRPRGPSSGAAPA